MDNKGLGGVIWSKAVTADVMTRVTEQPPAVCANCTHQQLGTALIASSPSPQGSSTAASSTAPPGRARRQQQGTPHTQ